MIEQEHEGTESELQERNEIKRGQKGTGIIDEPVQVRDGDADSDIIHEAVERALVAFDYWKDNMDRAETNLEYIFGEQYSRDDISELAMDNRVAMTFNKLPQFLNGVTGQQRSSVKTIKISPTGVSLGKEEPKLKTGSGKELPLSDILTDLTRNIEYESNAVSGYKMGFKHSLEGGFGWLRVLTDYQDDGFDLDIKIKGQRDRWAVLPDPDAVEQDMSDMNYCFISERMTVKEFQKRYPGKSWESMPGADATSGTTFWQDDKTVTVTEYFRREPYDKEIVQMSDGMIYDLEEVQDVLPVMEEQGLTIKNQRTVKSHKVIWCKMSQSDILEEDIEFPTTTIPMVPVLGREYDFRGQRRVKGLVDDGIDAQIALNKVMSGAIEGLDTSPIVPWVATDKAIEGYEEQWANANSIKFSTLVYRKGEERPTRERAPDMRNAETGMAQILDHQMKGSVGIFNASTGETSNEVSGKAILARQQGADTGTYEFLDNYENAIRRVGLLVVEMIPQVYDTERIVRIRGADGMSDTLEINKVVQDPNTGEEYVINDLNFGKYTVVVNSGQSYDTKQEQNAEQILELMKVNPKVSEVGSDLLVKNLDFADSDVLGERLERTIPPQFLSKEKREEMQKDAPPPQPSPEQIQAEADQKLKDMDMKMQQMELTAKTEIEKIKLETAKVNLQIKREELNTKQNEDERNIKKEEHQSKQELVKGVVDQMKPKKKEV